MMKKALVVAISTLLLAAAPAFAGEVNVLSGQAIEPGLVAATDAFRAQTGHAVKITYATTPEIRRRIGAGETADVVIAPPEALDEFAKAGKIEALARAPIGRVGVGVVVREGVPKPDVSTVDALKRAVLDADTVIYNRASSGLFVEGLLKRLGLADQIQEKTKRYSGTDMVEPMIHGKGKEIGFMPVAEILHFRGRGLQLAGPLPDDIQNYTTYAAELTSKSDAARDFIRFLETSAAKRIFSDAGVN